MSYTNTLKPLAALLLAGAALIGCGGGDAEPPPPPVGSAAPGAAPDTTAPTVTIANNVSAPAATGPVTFSFVFSEDVGTSFDGTDIVVTGGSAGAFTRVDGRQATLVVTPTPGVAGTMTVSVAAGRFTDIAGNANAAAASGSKNYTVPPPPPPPPTTGLALANFDSVSPPIAGFEGGEGSAVEAGPAGGAGNALKVLRSGGQVFALAIVTLPSNVPLEAGRKTISARVNSPTAGIPMVIKLEKDGDPGINSGDVQANETVVVGWQTLTWTINAVNTNYNKIVLLPNLGTVDAPPGKAYYFDDIQLLGVASGGGGAATVLANFDSVSPPIAGFEGGEGSAVEAGPAGGTGNALKVLRSGGQVFALAIVTLPSNIPLSTTRKTISARVNSPTAGIPMVIKLEKDGDPGINSGDVQANETVVVGWQTLTWTINAVNTNYNKIVLLPNLGTVDAPPGKAYYFDDIQLLGAPSGGGTPGPVTFSSGYTQGNRTAQGGEWGYFSGDFANATNTFTGGGFADSSPAFADANQFFFIAVTTSAPTAPNNNSGGFLGMFVTYPGATGLSIAGKTQLKINLGIDANMFQQATNKDFTVDIVGGIEYDNGSGGKCRTLLRKLVTPTTSDMITYTLALSTFTLAQPCNGGGFTSGVTSVAGAIAQGVQAVNSQFSFPNVNTTVNSGTVANPVYATGLTRGLTIFE